MPYLAAPNDGGGSSMLPLIMIVGLFALMYFMMIRPQQRRRREAERMQAAIGLGDEVVTIGGLYGTVSGVDDETLTLEVAPGVHVRYARPAIARVVTSTATADAEAADEPATGATDKD